MIVIFTTISYNVSATETEASLSGFGSMNLEVIDDVDTGITDEDFYEKTGCKATTEKVNCRGKDGKLYSFAKKP